MLETCVEAVVEDEGLEEVELEVEGLPEEVGLEEEEEDEDEEEVVVGRGADTDPVKTLPTSRAPTYTSDTTNSNKRERKYTNGWGISTRLSDVIVSSKGISISNVESLSHHWT